MIMYVWLIAEKDITLFFHTCTCIHKMFSLSFLLTRAFTARSHNAEKDETQKMFSQNLSILQQMSLVIFTKDFLGHIY